MLEFLYTSRLSLVYVLICIAIILICGSGIIFLTFTNDSRVFFSSESPTRTSLEQIEKTFNTGQATIIAIGPKHTTSDEAKKGALSSEGLAILGDIANLAKDIPYVARTDSPIITPVPHWTGKTIDYSVLKDTSNINREILFKNWLVSEDGKIAATILHLNLPKEDSTAAGLSINAIKAMLTKLKGSHPAFNFYLTGPTAGGVTFGEATKQDLKSVMPGAAIIIIFILVLILRSWGGVLGTIIVCIAAIITTMGIAGWLKFVLNPGSAAAPSIILTLAIADSIHIITGVKTGIQRGLNKSEAIIESLRLNLWPIFLTSATTVAGFLCMNASISPPLRDLGNITAIGLTTAFVFSVTLLPAILYVLPIGRNESNNVPQKMISIVALFIIRHRRTLGIITVIISIGLASGITKVSLDDSFGKYLDNSYEFRRDTDYLSQHLSTFDTIEHLIPAGGAGEALNDEYISFLDKLENWYRSQPGVVYVFSIATLAKRINQAKHKDDPKFFVVPPTGNRLMFENMARSNPDLAYQHYMDQSYSATRLSVILNNQSSSQLRDIASKANNWISDNAAQYFGPATSLSLLYAYVSEQNIKAMLISTGTAIIFISILLIFTLRSFRLGAISLIPNLMPTLIAIGMWGWFVGNLGLAGSVVTAMTLGIVVDNTIHFITTYLRARRKNASTNKEAIRYAFENTGKALASTSLVLVAGFSMLSFSGFKINATLGILTAITLVIALAITFIILPSILLMLSKHGPGKPNSSV